MADIKLTKIDNSTNVKLNKGATKEDIQSALQSALTAKISAEESANNASNSEANANESKIASANSATSASNSASTAITQAVLATTKASEASSLATDAATSESKAGEYAAAAAESESNASISETNAFNSAAYASTSASNALGSASEASSFASNANVYQQLANEAATTATDKAAEASVSATDAANSATQASISENNASNSATQASASAISASGSASTAIAQAEIATTKANESSNSAIFAASFASNAATSESNASASESNAATSATQAANSATEASGYATNAATYDSTYQGYLSDTEAARDAAQLAQTGAETAETNAGTYASNASTSAINATTSETNASNSASAAATSAINASTSETNAFNSATSASNSASTATTQAGISTTKASEASTSAANALTSENNASDSEDAAGASATAAALSASSASTSASNASTSATNANNSAISAASSASNASSYASTATTQASNAASSANAAGAAQLAAEAARDSALAAYDSFDDRYLGAKATEPTTDNDGNPLVAGTLYFSTTDEFMKLYTGSEWVAAYVSAEGALFSANNLSDLVNVSTARINLGLGSAATTDASSYEPADSTILKDADIGVTIQSYNANTVIDGSYVHTDNNYTTTEKTKLASIETGATADMTAGEILTAIKTVDGSGSGLDADLLDGQQGSYYQPVSTAITTSNIGSQSVSYASNAGTLDSIDSSQFLRSDVADTMTGNLTMNNTISYNDVSRYWLNTATNWGLYWDTTNNTIEMHGAGTDRWSCDLDNGNTVQAGTAQATGFKTSSGTSNQFLKADGSIDSNSYLSFDAELGGSTLPFGNFLIASGTLYVNNYSAFNAGAYLNYNELTIYDNNYGEGLSCNRSYVNIFSPYNNTTLSPTGITTDGSFIKQGGTSNQFLKADGSVTDSYDLGLIAEAGSQAGSGIIAKLDTDTYMLINGLSNEFLKADGSIDNTAYLPASSYTASDVLTKIKTVDGSGSGLDADTLDGNHASAFYLASNPSGYTTNTGTVTYVAGGTGLNGTITSGGYLGFYPYNLTTATTELNTEDYVIVSDSTVPKKITLTNLMAEFGNTTSFTSSKNTNGYTKLPNGMIIQWGDMSTVIGGDNVVTFPIAFPTACFSFVETLNNYTNYLGNSNVVKSLTATSATVDCASTSYGFMWIAIGY